MDTLIEPYFGAIDKNLSGFFILDDKVDDFTLLDVRDTNQIYYQDHEEERNVDLSFTGLRDYLDWRKTRKRKNPINQRNPRRISV